MTKAYGLIKGRHELPVEDYIIKGDIKDVTDLNEINNLVHKALKNDINVSLIVYVTGLTQVTGAVISYCITNLTPLTLMHFDRENGKYFEQVILSNRQVDLLAFNHDCHDLGV